MLGKKSVRWLINLQCQVDRDTASHVPHQNMKDILSQTKNKILAFLSSFGLMGLRLWLDSGLTQLSVERVFFQARRLRFSKAALTFN